MGVDDVDHNHIMEAHVRMGLETQHCSKERLDAIDATPCHCQPTYPYVHEDMGCAPAGDFLAASTSYVRPDQQGAAGTATRSTGNTRCAHSSFLATTTTTTIAVHVFLSSSPSFPFVVS